MSDLRLAVAQLDTVVGDLEGNTGLILAALGAAEAAGADLCIFPELAITGYPPEDLLLKPGFVAANTDALAKVAAATGDCAAVVGFVEPLSSHGDPRPPGPSSPSVSSDPAVHVDRSGHTVGSGEVEGRSEGRECHVLQPVRLANAAAVCAGGSVVGVYRKRLLPNYGVFDEQRWFAPGSGDLPLFAINGAVVGVSICEDVWFDDGPVAAMGAAGAQLVVNVNASPYSRGRRDERLAMLSQRVGEAGCPIAYVNQVGGQDELVFDGNSLVLGADGRLLAEGAQFQSDLLLVDVALDDAERSTGSTVIDVTPARRRQRSPLPAAVAREPLGPEAEVYEALVLGTGDYLTKNGFTDAVIGLSGGIDSSLVAVIAVDALGAEHVHGLSMPSRYSSDGSRSDAAALAEALGIDLTPVPIESAHLAMAGLLEPVLGHPPVGLPDENLQSRLRGVLLMAVSNDRGWIVLTTGNKSEMATGYSTLYGDSAGGFAVIKDVAKTLVYDLCRYRNERAVAEGAPPPVPEAVLTKPPSAELRPDQRDDQSLPPYEVLDPVLEAYVEHDRTAGVLVADGFDPAVVDQVVRLVDGSEYKRRQMPPGVRISTKAFGKDRRMPITNGFRPEPSAAPGGPAAPEAATADDNGDDNGDDDG